MFLCMSLVCVLSGRSGASTPSEDPGSHPPPLSIEELKQRMRVEIVGYVRRSVHTAAVRAPPPHACTLDSATTGRASWALQAFRVAAERWRPGCSVWSRSGGLRVQCVRDGAAPPSNPALEADRRRLAEEVAVLQQQLKAAVEVGSACVLWSNGVPPPPHPL